MTFSTESYTDQYGQAFAQRNVVAIGELDKWLDKYSLRSDPEEIIEHTMKKCVIGSMFLAATEIDKYWEEINAQAFQNKGNIEERLEYLLYSEPSTKKGEKPMLKRVYTLSTINLFHPDPELVDGQKVYGRLSVGIRETGEWGVAKTWYGDGRFLVPSAAENVSSVIESYQLAKTFNLQLFENGSGWDRLRVVVYPRDLPPEERIPVNGVIYYGREAVDALRHATREHIEKEYIGEQSMHA